MDNSPDSANDHPSDQPPIDASADASADETADEAQKPPVRPLRVWPAVLLVVLIWGLRIGANLTSESSFGVILVRFMAPLLLSLAILLWWMLLSRALIREKLIGTVLLVAIFAVTMMLSHETVIGFGTMIYAVPWGMSAFAVAAICARSWYPARTAIALLAALVGFGYWDLIRTDEIRGNFDTVQSWRWQPTAEDQFLETLATRPTPASEASSQPLADPEWPAFRGADRRGEQPGVVLAEDWEFQPPKEIWRIRIGPGWSSFSVAGNRLFTQEQRGEHEAVVCYSAVDGSEFWVHQDESRFWEVVGGAGPRGTPTISGQSLYTLGATGLLNRLDPLTGDTVWHRDIREDAKIDPPPWGFASSPLVTHGVVIIHAGDALGKGNGRVLAYDQSTGDRRWSAAAGDHSYSSPQLATFDEKECVLMLTNQGVHFVDPENGNLLGNHDWEFNGYRVVQPLMVEDSSVLLGTPMTGTLRVDVGWDGQKFTITDGWTSNRMNPSFNDFVAHKGFLYGFDNNIFACLDLKNGKRTWKRGRYGNGQVLLLPSGDQLLVTSEQGELILLRATPEKSIELARLQVLDGRTWNHPVLVGNRLYIRNGEEAACFEMPLQQSPR